MNEEQIKKDEVQSLARIFQEFKNGFDFLKKYPKSVSIMGSARFSPENEHSIQAQELAKKIVTELKYAVFTGGGGGIMGAANKGAHDADGISLGVTIHLPREQKTNPYLTEELHCNYFFTRKAILTFAAEAYVIFPGGFGTLDEFFGIITLIQTRKIPKVPIVLVGHDFWNPLLKFIREQMIKEHQTISKEDLDLVTVTDDLDEIIGIIRQAPVSRWWRHIER